MTPVGRRTVPVLWDDDRAMHLRTIGGSVGRAEIRFGRMSDGVHVYAK